MSYDTRAFSSAFRVLRRSLLLGAATTAFVAAPVHANPLGGTVTTGSASISVLSSKQTTVNQKSEGVVIDWSSFNIGSGQRTTFAQPNAQALAVNRIGGASASQIMGTLDANGRVVLINGNGLVFGKGAVVNVGSLVATSANDTDANLLAGKFSQAGNQNAALVNQGRINAGQGGFVALVAPSVTNAGTVRGKLGTVTLGGASTFTVDISGDGLVSFATQGVGPASVTNTGKLVGANVLLTARAAEGVATGVVNTSGTIVAQAAHNQGGMIVLDAGDGGDVAVSHAKLDASGANGGGSITIGGWNQASATVDKASVLDASAKTAGNGGTIAIIASAASFEGRALAQGGTSTGNGGHIETSGHVLDFTGARVNASSAHGTIGTWTLDPEDVTISSAATTNGSLTGGVFTPSGDNSILNVRTLESALKTAAVDVTTGNVGSQPGDITIAAPLSWASKETLTLDAYHSIDIDAGIVVKGAGGLDLVTNDGGTGGGLNFAAGTGRVTFDEPSSSLTIDGNAYVLAYSVAALASDIAKNAQGFYALAASYSAKNDGTYSSSPISTTFTGTFEGLGNTISNLTITDSAGHDNVGLFAEVDGGTVENIGLANANVTGGSGAIVGGLVANMSGAAVVSNAFATGNATGNDSESLGLLVGISGASGQIINSHATGAVTLSGSGGTLGGLAGSAGSITGSHASVAVTYNGVASENAIVGGLAGYGGNVTNSFSTGAVKGGAAYYTGGLVGGGDNIYITSSYASGPVWSTAPNSFVGGLCGFVSVGNVNTSFALGSVKAGAHARAGGLIGYDEYGYIINSYAMGNVAAGANSYVGGLVGEAYIGSIEETYSTGAVVGRKGSILGGLLGYDLYEDYFSSNYWDTTTSGITNLEQGIGNIDYESSVVTGLTTPDMQSMQLGFSSSIWNQSPSINNGFPYLLANPPPP